MVGPPCCPCDFLPGLFYWLECVSKNVSFYIVPENVPENKKNGLKP